MNRSIKGAVATAGAAALLVGGAGTLAFWSESETVTGTTVDAGHLNLVADATNTGCGAWRLGSGQQTPVSWNDGDPLLPGDVLTKECVYTIHAQGNHLRASLSVSTPSLSGTLAGGLVVDATDITVAGLAKTAFTEADDGSALGVTITVAFSDPGTADNTYNDPAADITAVLDAITLTASQVQS